MNPSDSAPAIAHAIATIWNLNLTFVLHVRTELLPPEGIPGDMPLQFDSGFRTRQHNFVTDDAWHVTLSFDTLHQDCPIPWHCILGFIVRAPHLEAPQAPVEEERPTVPALRLVT